MTVFAQIVQVFVQILVFALKWISKLFDQSIDLILGKDARKTKYTYRITGPASVNRLKPLLPQLDRRIIWQEATDPEQKVRARALFLVVTGHLN